MGNEAQGDIAPAPAETNQWRVPGVNIGWPEIGLIVAAVFVFAGGVALGHWSNSMDPYSELVRSCVQRMDGAPSCNQVINDIHEGTHTFPHFDVLDVLAEALKALSVALVVSVFVAGFLEGRNREKLNQTLTARAEAIAKNVFNGVFGNDHSKELLESLKRNILNKPVIRETLEVTYTLRSHTAHGDGTATVLKTSVKAKFKNIATAAGNEARVPLMLSLPNPLHPELKDMVLIEGGSMRRGSGKEEPFPQDDIDQANRTLRASLVDNNSLEGLVQFGLLKLSPGETGSFTIDYVMMKEAEDSELLRSFHTTNKISLTVIDETERSLFVRAKAIHPGELEAKKGSEHVYRWEMEDVFLPQQGVLIWWKEMRSQKPKRTRQSAKRKREADNVAAEDEGSTEGDGSVKLTGNDGPR